LSTESISNVLSTLPPGQTLRLGQNDDMIAGMGPGICIIAKQVGSQQDNQWSPIDHLNATNDVVAVAKIALEFRRKIGETDLFAICVPVADPSERQSIELRLQNAWPK
jgi:hypothetical protein